MTNQTVTQAWKQGKEASAGHFHTDGRRVYSYALLIGITAHDGRKIGLNARGKFSVSKTTSAHVGMIAQVADQMVDPVRENNTWAFSAKDFNLATYSDDQRAITPTYRQFSSESELAAYSSAFGYHWFDADSKRFFSSRIGSTVYHHPTDRTRWNLFISSERDTYSNQPRLYTVRQLNADGSISDIGEFQQHETSASARAAIKAYLKG